MKRIRLLIICAYIGIASVYAQQCFDMQTLNASSVQMENIDVRLLSVTQSKNEYTGQVTNHYLYGWVADTLSYGVSHPRHTLITQDGYDNLCPQLRTLPLKGSTSVRLASDGYYTAADTAKGEVIRYTYTVPQNRPLLILQYASVIEDPEHSIADDYPRYGSPWCHITVTLKGDTIFQKRHNPHDKETITDFQQFTDALGRNAWWKDWTIDSIDMGTHIGKTLTVTIDCRDDAIEKWDKPDNNSPRSFVFCEEHHLARIYFNLQCANYPYICEGTFTVTDTLCSNTDSLHIENHFSPGTIKTYDLLFDEKAHSIGLNNLTNQTLPTPTASIHLPLFEGLDSLHYPRPDTYTANLILHTICEKDTTIPLQFTLLYPSYILFQRWNDVLSVHNKENNGGYEFSHIEWYKDGRKVEGKGEHNGYYYSPTHFDYDNPSSYYVSLTRTDDNRTLCSCPFQPSPQIEEVEIDDLPISVETVNGAPVYRLKHTTKGTYTVYTYTGTTLYIGTIDTQTPVSLPQHITHGIIYFRLDNGETQIFRL
ncbi:MAG: hypothetical protein IJS00_01570 [Paludibacteraceae bacterium]|nr:hypothetical protein [Paludibacteraceae bacterium]